MHRVYAPVTGQYKAKKQTRGPHQPADALQPLLEIYKELVTRKGFHVQKPYSTV